MVLCFEELEVAIDFTLFFNIQQNGLNRNSVTVYSVKDTSHWRAPIFHTSTRRISFKMFEMKAIRSALVEIQKAQAWCVNRAINDDDENELDDIKTAEDAIHAAIKRARMTRKRISSFVQKPVTRQLRESAVTRVRSGLVAGHV